MKKMRTILMPVLCALLLAATAAAETPVQRIHEIQHPLISEPVFVLPGGDFAITLKAGKKTPAGARLMGVTNEGAEVALELGEANKAGEGLTAISATVPGDAAVGLYDLEVSFKDGSTDKQPHAVKVLKEFKKEFDFIHFTDIHFNVQHLKDRDMNRIRTKILQEMTDINPEFAIFGGDLGLNPETYPLDYIYGYEQFVEYMKVPMFMVPGNHEMYVDDKEVRDIDGRKFWEATYGATYRSFDYDGLHVTGINTFDWEPKFRERFNEEMVFFGTVINAFITPDQWNWLKDDLEKASEAGQNIVAFTHIPINTLQGGRKIGYMNPVKMKGPNVDQFVKLMNHYGVSHIFTGHMHYNKITDYGDMQEVMTEAAGISGDDISVFWGFRIVHVKDGKVTGWDIHEIGFKDLN